MSEQLQLTGMVIYSAPVGEYDKRVVLLTKERGKITAFARGARRPKSTLRAETGTFASGTFGLFEGRDAYTLVSANIFEYFEPLIMDLDASFYGSYFLEFAGYYARENLEASDTLNLLFVSLKALVKGKIPKRLIRCLFEIRLMVISGEYPQDAAWDSSLRESTRYAMQQAIAAPLTELYSFTVTNEVLSEMIRIQDRIRNGALDRKLKSLEILEGLTGL